MKVRARYGRIGFHLIYTAPSRAAVRVGSHEAGTLFFDAATGNWRVDTWHSAHDAPPAERCVSLANEHWPHGTEEHLPPLWQQQPQFTLSVGRTTYIFSTGLYPLEDDVPPRITTLVKRDEDAILAIWTDDDGGPVAVWLSGAHDDLIERAALNMHPLTETLKERTPCA